MAELNQETEKWLNLEDIADHLSVSKDTIKIWIKFPFIKLGKCISLKFLK